MNPKGIGCLIQLKTIIVSHDVVFEEDCECDWKNFDCETELVWRENIENNENTIKEGEITEELIESVEPANCPVVVAPSQ